MVAVARRETRFRLRDLPKSAVHTLRHHVAYTRMYSVWAVSGGRGKVPQSAILAVWPVIGKFRTHRRALLLRTEPILFGYSL